MTKTIRERLASYALVALCIVGITAGIAAAAEKVEGVYVNAEGTTSIEFKADGTANFTLNGQGGECTYKIEGNKLTLIIEDQTTVFTINADGSLTGPKDTYLSRLTKKKQ